MWTVTKTSKVNAVILIIDCTTSFLCNYKHNLSLMMQYVVTLWQNWHEENFIARMLHLVQNVRWRMHRLVLLHVRSRESLRYLWQLREIEVSCYLKRLLDTLVMKPNCAWFGSLQLDYRRRHCFPRLPRLAASGWQPLNRVPHSLQQTALVKESGSKNLHLADFEASFKNMTSWTIYSLSLLAIFVIGGRAFTLPTFNPIEESPPKNTSYNYYAETFLGSYTGPWWVHHRTIFPPNNWGACGHPSLHSLQDGWHTELLRSRAGRYWARFT